MQAFEMDTVFTLKCGRRGFVCHQSIISLDLKLKSNVSEQQALQYSFSPKFEPSILYTIAGFTHRVIYKN